MTFGDKFLKTKQSVQLFEAALSIRVSYLSFLTNLLKLLLTACLGCHEFHFLQLCDAFETYLSAAMPAEKCIQK